MSDTRQNKDADDAKQCSPGSVLSAMARLMQFVEKLESHTTMLDSMPIDAAAKWDTIAGLVKKDVPALKKDVSEEMTGFLAMLIKRGDA